MVIIDLIFRIYLKKGLSTQMINIQIKRFNANTEKLTQKALR
jgi:hypothetical protein